MRIRFILICFLVQFLNLGIVSASIANQSQIGLKKSSHYDQTKYEAVKKGQRGWTATNAKQGWKIKYGVDGQTVLSSTHEQQRFHIGMQLEALGYGELDNVPNKPYAISFNDKKLNYHWNNNLTEYWTNTPFSTEQWFELKQRPNLNVPSEPLQLSIKVDTNLAMVQQGKQLIFTDGSDIRIHYKKLKVWDATGQILPAEMELIGQNVKLKVDDQKAIYPLTIDPQFVQSHYIKASNSDSGDNFGNAVAISGDTLVVGAIDEDGDGSGTLDNSVPNAGAVYVYIKSGNNWAQQAYLKSSNPIANEQFGYSVAIEGDTLVVGTGFSEETAYVFTRSNGVWSESAILTASNSENFDLFGWSVAISGSTIAVSAIQEDSASTGVNGNQSDVNNTAVASGAVYVFVEDNGTWNQQAYIKASNTDAGDTFGSTVILDGDNLIVSAPYEASGATGINSNQSDNSVPNSGAAYVFTRTGTTWSQQAYIKPSQTPKEFGLAMDMSNDTLVIGSRYFNSGVGGFNAAVFVRNGNAWSEQAIIENPQIQFTTSVVIEGNSLLLGDANNNSGSVGIGGNPDDTSEPNSGAVFAYQFENNSWQSKAFIKASNTGEDDNFGTAMARDGSTLIVGAPQEDLSGAVYAFELSPLIGGEVQGLTPGNTLTLVNNDSEVLFIDQDGLFNFVTPVLNGEGYSVSGLLNLPNQTCLLSNESGIVGTNDITDVVVDCNTEPDTEIDVYQGLEDTNYLTTDPDGTITGDISDDGTLANDFDLDNDSLEVLNPGTYTMNGIGGSLTLNTDGTFTYVPAPDAFGTAFYEFEVTDGVQSVEAFLVIGITSVNDAPTFNVIGDVVVNLFDVSMNPFIVNDFAENIVMGPANESDQSIKDFFVTVQSDSNGIISSIDINNNKMLSVNFTGNYGSALVDVVLQDDEGTENGGADVSMVQSFHITHTDVVFNNGFEDSINFKVFSVLASVQSVHFGLDAPIYDEITDSVEFYGEFFSLHGNYHDVIQANALEQWMKEVLIAKAPMEDFDSDGTINLLDQKSF
ncbi:Ig-like domain-containing protein [Marinicella rhabdoformis]|uniref:Ig-like domain-containing protein n=1 Tax=Marinicella rhabdoformis TaxID=2580566 RepID=UPI0015D09433|nr:cadherin-like domain-containing protein [Marinicella rhabdoformis]